MRIRVDKPFVLSKLMSVYNFIAILLLNSDIIYITNSLYSPMLLVTAISILTVPNTLTVLLEYID